MMQLKHKDQLTLGVVEGTSWVNGEDEENIRNGATRTENIQMSNVIAGKNGGGTLITYTERRQGIKKRKGKELSEWEGREKGKQWRTQNIIMKEHG